jgi:hypothetical protein
VWPRRLHPVKCKLKNTRYLLIPCLCFVARIALLCPALMACTRACRAERLAVS